MNVFQWSVCALFVLVLVVYPIVAWRLRSIRISKDPSNAPPERALALPNGSIRAMLALLAVGTFVLVLAHASQGKNFAQAVTAFGTLTGAMIGFYFGTRTAQKTSDLPNGSPDKKTPALDKNAG